MRYIIATAALLALSGCAQSMICRPVAQDGTQRCDPVVYAPQQPPVAYSPYVHDVRHEPGYAPAYPPIDTQPPRMHRRDAWVTDTPHWQPGDE